MDCFPIVAVMGARLVGKSILIEHLFADKTDLLIFDPVLDVDNGREDPEFFLQKIKSPAVLDEVQYAPQLLPVIKRQVDREKGN